MWIKDEKPLLWYRDWVESDGDLTRAHHREEEVCRCKAECTRCRQYIPIGSIMTWRFPARNSYGQIRDYARNRVWLRCELCQYELDLEEQLKPRALQDLMPWELPVHLLAREGEDEDSTVRRIEALRRDLEEIDENPTVGVGAAKKGNQWPEPTAEGVPSPLSPPEEVAPLDKGIPEGSKRCRSCDAVKTLDEFTADNAQPDGRYTSCRECKNARQREARSAGGVKRKKSKASPQEKLSQTKEEIGVLRRESVTRATDKILERRAAEKAAKALSE